MPTYRIIDRTTGQRVPGVGNVLADSPFFSLSAKLGMGDDPAFDEARYEVEQVSPNPPSVVYTVVQAARGGDVHQSPWEVCTTGDRGRAMQEAERVGGGNGSEGGSGNGNGKGNGRGPAMVIEESVEVNRIARKERRS